MSQKKQEYVLGTGLDELSRLGIQHRIWADAAVTAWRKAGIGPGRRVLDLGCGPGHATFDMAQLVTESGHILALDESTEFIDKLNAQAKQRELTQILAKVADAQNFSSQLKIKNSFDHVYCRWVLCWLKDPFQALSEIHQTLKPGGRVILHDYFNWRSMCLAPRSQAVEKMVQAAVSSFEDRSGNVDVAADVPGYLKRLGFRTLHFDVIERVVLGGGQDSTAAWPLSWWRSYGPKLVQIGKLSQTDCEQALNDLNRLENSDDCFFVCPPVFEFIAEKI